MRLLSSSHAPPRRKIWLWSLCFKANPRKIRLAMKIDQIWISLITKKPLQLWSVVLRNKWLSHKKNKSVKRTFSNSYLLVSSQVVRGRRKQQKQNNQQVRFLWQKAKEKAEFMADRSLLLSNVPRQRRD